MHAHHRSTVQARVSVGGRVAGLVAAVCLLSLAWWLSAVQAAPLDQPPPVTSYTLINALTEQPIAGYDPIPEGALIDLAALPTRRLNIRANTPQAVGSVAFALNGGLYNVENEQPYALAGNIGANYLDWVAAAGAYSLVGTTYSGGSQGGTAGAAATLHFTFSDSSSAPIAVTGFTLIDAVTDQPIAGYDPIPAGAILDLAALPTRSLNIRANTEPSVVGSVVFSYDGKTARVENSAPYALGSDASGDYAAWTPAVGEHSLRGTPYSAGNAGGSLGTALTLPFTVIDGQSNATQTAEAGTATSVAATSIAATQTAEAGTATSVAATDTAATSIAATSIAATQTAAAPSPTSTATTAAATATNIAATQTAAPSPTSTATTAAATATNIVATQTAAPSPTSTATTAAATLTATAVSPTIATATQPTGGPRPLYLPIILK
jgi:hypothetical protein